MIPIFNKYGVPYFMGVRPDSISEVKWAGGWRKAIQAREERMKIIRNIDAEADRLQECIEDEGSLTTEEAELLIEHGIPAKVVERWENKYRDVGSCKIEK